jgi:hypothetical protein
MLAKWVTPANHEELFAAAAFKSKRQVEELLADRFPQPDVRSSVRKLPAPVKALTSVLSVPSLPLVSSMPSAPPVASPSPLLGASAPTDVSSVPGTTTPTASTAASLSRGTIRPLGAGRYEIRFTASAEMRENLRLAQDLLSHSVPSRNLAQVFDRALIALVADLTRTRFAVVKRPRRPRGTSRDSPNVPAEVRRAVYQRDGGRCAFVARSGRRCNDRRFIQLHHVMPEAAGGKPTVENMQLRCRAHNGHEVDLFFGPGKRYTTDGEVRETMAVYGTLEGKGSVRARNGILRRAIFRSGTETGRDASSDA